MPQMTGDRAVKFGSFPADQPGISIFSDPYIIQIFFRKVGKWDEYGQTAPVYSILHDRHMAGNSIKALNCGKNITEHRLFCLYDFLNMFLKGNVHADKFSTEGNSVKSAAG